MTAAGGEDILSWLDTAITRREEAARDALRAYASSWARPIDTDMVRVSSDGRIWFQCLSEEIAEHIVMNDPASVLRRCAADRKLLTLHQAVPDHGRYSEPECPADCDGQHDGPPVCMSCRDYAGDPLQAPCTTVLTIAEGYGWTADKRQSWLSLRGNGWTEGER